MDSGPLLEFQPILGQVKKKKQLPGELTVGWCLFPLRCSKRLIFISVSSSVVFPRRGGSCFSFTSHEQLIATETHVLNIQTLVKLGRLKGATLQV